MLLLLAVMLDISLALLAVWICSLSAVMILPGLLCIYCFFLSLSHVHENVDEEPPYRVHPVSFWRHGRMLPDLVIGDACLGGHASPFVTWPSR